MQQDSNVHRVESKLTRLSTPWKFQEDLSLRLGNEIVFVSVRPERSLDGLRCCFDLFVSVEITETNNKINGAFVDEVMFFEVNIYWSTVVHASIKCCYSCQVSCFDHDVWLGGKAWCKRHWMIFRILSFRYKAFKISAWKYKQESKYISPAVIVSGWRINEKHGLQYSFQPVKRFSPKYSSLRLD